MTVMARRRPVAATGAEAATARAPRVPVVVDAAVVAVGAEAVVARGAATAAAEATATRAGVATGTVAARR
jgi:hypothetical protein